MSKQFLLRSTALQAAVAVTMTLPARGQPAPNARPQGGQVVAGSAAIARTPTSTVITQSSDRAAIDWRSFDVGKNQAVTFQQSGSGSATLNRVTGPDPSAIAGRISANGQIVLTNPNGVTFFQGAQVNAASVIVSAPGISNQNFMAGRMVFDREANPNARVENAGSITVKQAGLAALVAPSVANSGTITARLGHVVLAGAAAHTLDMYGDGLVSIDVTKQVRQAPVGPGGQTVTALVTNTGTIVADGGTVQLTARAADGVVQNLVSAGGVVRARGGQIEIAGTGGAVVIDGRVSADGNGVGGTVVLNGSTATVLTDAAHVSADGRAGGGTVAIGTTLARARSSGPAPAATSARTTLAAGSVVSASAGVRGNGGRVTVLSTEATSVAGTVAAKGGAQSGDGGTIELSGATGFRLTGHADTRAPHGTVGTIVLDPRDLLITDSPPAGTANQAPNSGDPNIAANAGGTTTDAYVTPDQLENQFGNIHVLTTRDLTVASPLTSGSATSITLEAGRDLSVTNGGSISTYGNLTLVAGSSTIAGFDPTGRITIGGSIGGQTVSLEAGSRGVMLMADVTATIGLKINTTGALSQTAGIVSAPQMYGSAASVNLPNANAIVGVGNGQNAAFQTTGGGFLLDLAGQRTLTIGNAQGGGGLFVPTGQSVTLVTDRLSLAAASGGKAITASGGTLTISPATSGRQIVLSDGDTSEGGSLFVDTGSLGTLAVGTLQLGTTAQTGDISIGNGANLTAAGIGTLALGSTGSITQFAPLQVAALSIAQTNAGEDVVLTYTNNQIGSLTAAVSGNINVATAGAVRVGDLTTPGSTVGVSAGGSITQSGSRITSGGSVDLAAGYASVSGADPAAALVLTGGISAVNFANLSARDGGITLTGTLAAQTLAVSTTGSLVATGAVSVSQLNGRASTASLTSTGNQVMRVNGFSTTGAAGDFTLVNASPLTVGGGSSGISVQNGRMITLMADQLDLVSNTSNIVLTAVGGRVVVEPFSPATPILLTSSAKPGAGTLALTTNELGQISTGQLVLGTAPGSGTRNTGPITIGRPGEAIAPSSIASLALETTGLVTQGGALTVTTLGGNVGTMTLTNTGNQISTLAGVAASGDVSVRTARALSVGDVAAGGNVALVSGGTMTLTGAISGVGVDLEAAPSAYGGILLGSGDAPIVQTGGKITASTLTGIAYSALLTGGNAIGSLGNFTTYDFLALNDGANPLAVTGTVMTTVGALTLRAGGLSESGRIVTPELDGTSSADAVLTSTSNVINAVGNFAVSAGSLTLVDAASQLTLGVGGGQVSAANGSLTFRADGIGVAAATRTVPAIDAPQGVVAFTPFTPGRPIQVIGSGTASPGTLSIGPDVTSQLSAQRLVIGTAGSSSAVAFGGAGDRVALPIPLLLQTTGAVTQGSGSVLSVASLSGTAGSIALSSAVNSIGTVTGLSTTSGSLSVRTGGAMAISDVTSAGDLTLVAAGAATLGGTIAGAGITIAGVGGIVQTGGTVTASGTLSLAAGAGQAISQTGGEAVGSLSAPVLTTQSGTVSLPGANTIGSANLAATGSVTFNDQAALILTGLTGSDGTVTDASNLSLAGTVSVSGGLVLGAGGAIGQSSGRVTAASLTTNSATLAMGGANMVGTANLSAKGGVSFNDAASLTLSGLSAGDAAITASGQLSLTGVLSAGSLSLRAASIAQPGGTITTGTLSVSATGQVALGQTNAIGALGAVSSVGGLLVADAGDLGVAGPLSDGTAISLRAGGSLTLGGSVTTGALTLSAGGSVTQTGGSIGAASLSGSAASAALSGPNQIDTLGDFSAPGGFALTDGAALTVNGTVSVGAGSTLSLVTPAFSVGPSGFLSAAGGTVKLAEFAQGQGLSLGSGRIAAGTLSLGSPTGGPITITAGFNPTVGTLDLESGGDITEAGAGALQVGTLTGRGATVTLGGANGIGTLGAFTATGAFTLNNGGDLAVSGLVTGASVSLSSSGNIALAGTVAAIGTLNLVATGTITQSAGAIVAGGLSGTAASASFNQGAAVSVIASTTGGTTGDGPAQVQLATASGGPGGTNQVGAINDFATTNGFSLTDGQGLTVAGTLTDRNVGISLAAPSMTFGGSVVAPALSVNGAGAVAQSGGAVTVGTLSGSVGSLDLGNAGQAAIGTIGRFSATGSMALTDATALRIAGPVAAPRLVVTSTGALLLDGGSIRTDGAPLAAQLGGSPAAGGSTLAVRGGAGGVTQTGTTTISSYSGGPATLRIELSGSGGTLQLSDLEAPGGNLVLSLGTGSVTGKVVAERLVVLGAGGTAMLTGQIGGRSDAGAALLAQKLPGSDLRYTFNDCAIASITCSSDVFGTLISPAAAIASVLRPDILTLGILDLSVTRDRDDPTLLLPNISDRDY